MLSPAQNTGAGQTSVSAVSIQVIQPIVNAKIQVSQNGVLFATASSCQEASGAASDIVQDAGLVDLNQPANCFSLQDSSEVNYSSVHLSVVVPKAAAVKVAVVIPQSKISVPDFLPTTGGQPLPVLPLTFVTAGLIFALWETKLSFRKLAVKAASLKFTLSLHQLQVLRC